MRAIGETNIAIVCNPRAGNGRAIAIDLIYFSHQRCAVAHSSQINLRLFTSQHRNGCDKKSSHIERISITKIYID